MALIVAAAACATRPACLNQQHDLNSRWLQARDFLESCIDNLNTQKDTFEAELEVARAKKKSKAAPTEREKELDNQRERHNWHVERIELMLRLLDNDNLTTEDVNSIKDDFEYYITSNQDPDFQEDETIYDALDLDAYEGKDGGLDVLKQTKKEKEKEAAEKARLEREEQEREENRKKEEIRKAEMEKKRKLEEEKRLKEEQRRQAEAERRKAEEDRRKAQLLDQQRLQQQQQQQQRQQDAAAAAAGGKKPGMDGKMPIVGGQPGVPASQVASRGAPGPVPGGKGQMSGAVGPGQQGQQGQGPKQTFLSQLRNESGKDGEWEHGGLGGGDLAQDNFGDFGGGEESGADDHQERLNMLEASMKWLPDSVEPERPFKPLFDNPAVFEKLDQDTLFFIFYFQTGTLQQFLAARELKRQGWRFHKKYLTWFQRHEEPVSTDHQGERGTYVYFDYETGWCQRIKSDFTFDYYFLEDEVVPAPPRMD